MKTKMRRYGFALGMTFGLSLLSSVAMAQKVIVTANVPETHWSSVQVVDPFVSCVAEKDGGELDFEYYHSGQIASNTQALDAVNSGLAQIALVVISAQSDKLPLSGIAMLPGLGSSVAGITAAFRAELEASGPIAQEYAAANIVPLIVNVYPPYQMVSRGTELDSLSDIQGKRISGGGGALLVTLAAIGAVGVETPAADLYIALQQGIIDGSMISLASVTPYSLQEVIRSASINAHFGTSLAVWTMDADFWDGLSASSQNALRECGLQTETALAAWVDGWMLEVQTQLEESGITLFEYTGEASADINEKLDQARKDYLARLSARGLPAEEAFLDLNGRFGN